MPIQLMDNFCVGGRDTDQIVFRPESAGPFKAGDGITMPVDPGAEIDVGEREQIDAVLAEDVRLANGTFEPFRKVFCDELRCSSPAVTRRNVEPPGGGFLPIILMEPWFSISASSSRSSRGIRPARERMRSSSRRPCSRSR